MFTVNSKLSNGDPAPMVPLGPRRGVAGNSAGGWDVTKASRVGTRRLPLLLGSFLLLLMLVAAQASTPDALGSPANGVDFTGKRIRVTTCTGAGGGLDILTRLLVAQAAKRLPGDPEVVVDYNSVIYASMNDFYKNAAPDGTRIYACGDQSVLAEVVGRHEVQYRTARLRPIFVMPNPEVFVIQSGTGYNEPRDLASLKRPLVYGHIDPSLAENLAMIFWSKLLPEMRMKFVFGYDSASAVRLALVRGEIDMTLEAAAAFFSSAIQDEIRSGTIKPAFQLGAPGPGNSLVRVPMFAAYPTLEEVYRVIKSRPPQGPDWQIVLAMVKIAQNAGLVWYLPPGTPDRIYDAWTGAMTAVTSDPKLMSSAKRVAPVSPVIGSEATQGIMAALEMSPQNRKLLRDLLSSEYHVSF